jgi:hypothetical protein
LFENVREGGTVRVNVGADGLELSLDVLLAGGAASTHN